jgi:predicted nucleic acid-binding protein
LALVEAILAAFDAVPITEPVARIHADIWTQLSTRGSVIGNQVLWLAATVISNGLLWQRGTRATSSRPGFARS